MAQQKTTDDELAQWCAKSGFPEITDGLKEFAEDSAFFAFLKDTEIAEIESALAMPLKCKLKFRKAVKQLKTSKVSNSIISN